MCGLRDPHAAYNWSQAPCEVDEKGHASVDPPAGFVPNKPVDQPTGSEDYVPDPPEDYAPMHPSQLDPAEQTVTNNNVLV